MPPKKTKTVGSSSQKTSQKRKYVEEGSEESSSSLRRSSRISSQSSNLTETARDLESLELTEPSTNRYNLPSSASKFYTEDIELLKVTFVRASAKNVVIPDVQNDQFQASFQKLRKYLLPNIDSEILANAKFDVTTHANITSVKVQTFVTKLNYVVVNGAQQTGTDETFTDTLIDNLLRITKLDDFPLMIRNHPFNRIYIKGDGIVTSDPEFVVQEKGKISLIVVEDKHLKNVTAATGFGESQIAIEMLACGSENIHSLGEEEPMNQTIFGIRVISTYVTFYKAVITSAYWKELLSGLPKKQSVEIQRWPVKNGLRTGFDIAEPAGRQTVLESLVKIRESLLVKSNDEKQTDEVVIASGSGSKK